MSSPLYPAPLKWSPPKREPPREAVVMTYFQSDPLHISPPAGALLAPETEQQIPATETVSGRDCHAPLPPFSGVSDAPSLRHISLLWMEELTVFSQ